MNVVNENLAEDFYEYLALERSMAENSIDAYRHDIDKLIYYLLNIQMCRYFHINIY